jgi:hypothetical protein
MKLLTPIFLMFISLASLNVSASEMLLCAYSPDSCPKDSKYNQENQKSNLLDVIELRVQVDVEFSVNNNLHFSNGRYGTGPQTALGNTPRCYMLPSRGTVRLNAGDVLTGRKTMELRERVSYSLSNGASFACVYGDYRSLSKIQSELGHNFIIGVPMDSSSNSGIEWN